MPISTRTALSCASLVGAVIVATSALGSPVLIAELRGGVLRSVDALRSLGHGTLDIDDGFILAMLVMLACAPLPLALIGVGLGDHRGGMVWPLITSTAVVLAVAALAAVRSDGHWSAYCSLVFAGTVGSALGTLVGAAWRARRQAVGPSRRTRWTAGLVATAYATSVALVATHASPIDRNFQPQVQSIITALRSVGAPHWVGYDAVEFTANVAFFVPFGFLALLLLGARAWWVGVAGGFAVSCAIETVQGLFLPQRYASVDDVVANTSGAIIGVLLGIVVLGKLRARRA